MLSLLQKTFKVFLKLKVNAFFLNLELAAPKDIMRFEANFFVSLAGSRHLGEMETSTND